MRVLAAPTRRDPRPDGFVYTMPGELLYRPFVCDTGREGGGCECGRSWAGMTTAKGTTIAEVTEQPLTTAEYTETFSAFLVDAWGWSKPAAIEEAGKLAAIAEEFPTGTLITIEVHGDSHVFDELEV